MLINLPNISIIDYIFIIFLLIMAINSFIKGFLGELMSLISLVLAGFISYKTGAYFSLYLSSYIIVTKVIYLIIFVFEFIILYFMLNILLQMIVRPVQRSIGFFDRIIGLIFGCLKTLLIILVFYILLDMIVPINIQPDFLAHSISRKFIEPIKEQLFYNANNDIISPININT